MHLPGTVVFGCAFCLLVMPPVRAADPMGSVVTLNKVIERGRILPLWPEPILQVMADDVSLIEAHDNDLAAARLSDPNHLQTISEDQIVRWGTWSQQQPTRCIAFRDGSRWSLGMADSWTLDDHRLQISRDGQILSTLPRNHVHAILCQLPQDTMEFDQQFDRWTAPTSHDRCISLSGDVHTGEIIRGTHESLLLRKGVQEVRLSLLHVAAVVFGPSPSITPQSDKDIKPTRQQIIGLRDGSRLHVSRLARVSDTVTAVLADGVTSLDCTWGTSDQRDVVAWMSASPHILYISDLQPDGYRHIPFMRQERPIQWDRNRDGGSLRLSGEICPKGIGTTSTSRLAIPIATGYTHFAADVGIDDAAGEGGSVIFRVLLLRDGQWHTSYTSPVLRGGDRPQPVHVPVNGATLIALVTDFAEQGDVLDLANWAYARLERQTANRP